MAQFDEEGYFYDTEEERQERYEQFERPYENSALTRATKVNPRNLSCPTCKEPNKLTPKDKSRGYQCDDCADRDEGFGGY